MPVEDAEKVIAKYEAEHAKPAKPVPAIPVAEGDFGSYVARTRENY